MNKTRMIVLTDISTLQADHGEPDDTQSLVRLLLYADSFDIEGLIATYTEHGKGRVMTEYLESIVQAYGKVRENLLQHSPDFPPKEKLLETIKAGSAQCGTEQIGKGMDTEGSDWIIHVVDKPDPRPIWITIWGGAVDLAQALWQVKNSRSKEEFEQFCSRIRVHAISDQYDEAGPWIRKNCPGVFYITSYKTFRGMYHKGDSSLVTREWVQKNLCRGHGPLGDAYPNYDGGDIWGSVQGVKEGDTPSFLYLIPNGLGDPEHPQWGSWGGRFEGEHNQYTDASDTWNGQKGILETVCRWRTDYQNAFQARMDWCTKSYEEANHEPYASISIDRTDNMVDGTILAHPGDIICFNGRDSYDPDGGTLDYHWWIYEEAGSFQENVILEGKETAELTVRIPENVTHGEIHLILTVTDSGEPPLAAYDRKIIQVV